MSSSWNALVRLESPKNQVDLHAIIGSMQQKLRFIPSSKTKEQPLFPLSYQISAGWWTSMKETNTTTLFGFEISMWSAKITNECKLPVYIELVPIKAKQTSPVKRPQREENMLKLHLQLMGLCAKLETLCKQLAAVVWISVSNSGHQHVNRANSIVYSTSWWPLSSPFRASLQKGRWNNQSISMTQ